MKNKNELTYMTSAMDAVFNAVVADSLSAKPKHTPGPWVACPGQTTLVMRKKDWDDSQVHFGVMKDSMQILTSLKNGAAQAEADSHLIAAAPEMLEALEKFKSEFIENNSRAEWHESHSDIQRIIDKARGEK